MNKPECIVKKCNNYALLLYGNNWICGDCYMKIYNKELERKNKLVEEIGL